MKNAKMYTKHFFNILIITIIQKKCISGHIYSIIFIAEESILELIFIILVVYDLLLGYNLDIALKSFII